jgi:general secretion pathway protein G
MKTLGAWSREFGAKRTFWVQKCGVSVGVSRDSTRYSPPVTNHSARRADGAFTLIELLLVMAVIAVLAGLTIASLGGVNEKTARDLAKAEVAAIASALESYRTEQGSYPAPLSSSNVPHALIRGYLPAEKMTVVSNTIMDPYGQPYVYRLPGGDSPTRSRVGFDLYSVGKDPKKTNAWIGNW